MTTADLECYLRRLAAGDRRADCNRDRLLNAADLACVLDRMVAAGIR